MHKNVGASLVYLFTLFVIFTPLPTHPREIPLHEIPVPTTVSPQLQDKIASGLPQWWNTTPSTDEEWKHFKISQDDSALNSLNLLFKNIDIKCVPGVINGIPIYTISPSVIPLQNINRILLNLHGGGYVLNQGKTGLGEAMYMAVIGGFKVIFVDYRMAPEFPYSAALDDSMAVYKALLKQYPASHIGVFGTSTGGALTIALVLRARSEGLPLPGAIACGTPWTDLTKTGDTYFTNEYVDNVLVSYDGWLKKAAESYAGRHDMRDPMLSPIYGDVKGFPPVFLAAGTRDLFLSNTVRMHRKLREADVPADLVILEGMSHAQYLHLPPDAPETKYYFQQVAKFFERYLK